jgi:tetrahydromethanopterin S-methyltransferase subunit G
MSNEPTQDLPDETDRTTQPTITAVFELVRELKQGVDAINARLDATNARLDEMEGRHARDFAEMKAGFIRLEDKIDRITVHSDAEYHDLRRRMRDLESKAS